MKEEIQRQNKSDSSMSSIRSYYLKIVLSSRVKFGPKRMWTTQNIDSPNLTLLYVKKDWI